MKRPRPVEPPPRYFPAEASGWTPVLDSLIAKYGSVTALVWGRVWRYCRMPDGFCRASLSRLATELGLSLRTVQRHVHILCRDGYLEDLTPNLQGKPHHLRDTGKVALKLRLTAEQAKPSRHVLRGHYDDENHWSPA